MFHFFIFFFRDQSRPLFVRMQFDEFYKNLDSFGRYQKVKYFLICLTYMFPPIMVYTWSFTAATPAFRCRFPTENSTAKFEISPEFLRSYQPTVDQCKTYQNQISTKECQRCFQTTSSVDEPLQPCTKFVFQRSPYQSTLVEEVRRTTKNFDSI